MFEVQLYIQRAPLHGPSKALNTLNPGFEGKIHPLVPNPDSRPAGIPEVRLLPDTGQMASCSNRCMEDSLQKTAYTELRSRPRHGRNRPQAVYVRLVIPVVQTQRGTGICSMSVYPLQLFSTVR